MPRRPPASSPAAKTVAEGLAIWVAYESSRRLGRIAGRVAGEVRRALFGWSDYPRYLRDRSVTEGVFNGRKAWLAVGAVVWGAHAVRKSAGRTEQVVLREVLAPGEQVFITQAARPSRRRGRKAGSSG